VDRAAAVGVGIFISATSGPGANCGVDSDGATSRGFVLVDSAVAPGCAPGTFACVFVAGAIPVEEPAAGVGPEGEPAESGIELETGAGAGADAARMG
jgi:hypothetical protein